MKILVLASTFPRWDRDTVPEFVFELSKNLSKQAEVFVIAPHDKGAKYAETLHNLKIYRFPYFFPGAETLAYRGGMVNRFKESVIAKIQLPFYLLSLFLYTYYISVSKRIDIIHAHWLFPQGFIAYLVKIITRKRIIITTHGGDVALMKNKLFSLLLRNALKRADKVTYVSQINADLVGSIVGNDTKTNSSILPMGVYLPNEADINTTPTPGAPMKILFIGRLVAIKGVDVLLQSFAKSIQSNPNMSLTILGDGPLKNDYEQLSRTLNISDKVSFMGYTIGEAKNNFLKECHIVVVSSIIDKHGFQEGLPVTALEAMAYGKVLIATRTGGLTELVDGKNGILVEQNNIDALADAITKLVRNLRHMQEISQNARKTITKYSWDSVAGKMWRLIQETYE